MSVEKIRELNDKFRTSMQGGRFVMTSSVGAKGVNFVVEAMAEVMAFTGFNEMNDPHKEHDYGSVVINGSKVMFKIDYYQKGTDYTFGAENPENEETTDRVLTLMLESDY